MSDVSINIQQPKLLIIDDDKEITDLIERLVDVMEWMVLSVNDSKLISSTCKVFIPDVIFLDLGLPGYSGSDVIHHLSDLNCNARIYLISGLDRVSLESCQAIGVECDLNIVGALTKPFTGEDIFHALEIQQHSPGTEHAFHVDLATTTMLNHDTHADELLESIPSKLNGKPLLKQGSNEVGTVADTPCTGKGKEGGPGNHVLTKNVTILLSDIRGFAEITENYPAPDVVYMLNRYFEVMGEIITRYGGSINKLMGDSIFVLFGISESKPDDVENALACAIEMQLAMTELNEVNQALDMPDLYMGIALNTGKVVACVLGSRHYKEYTVIGEEVNLTSRIEAHCLRGQILISENTFDQAREFIEVGVPVIIEVKGVRKAVRIYELQAVSKPRLMRSPCRERRKSPRINVLLPVTFQFLNGKIVLREKHRGEVIDLSYTGLLIQTDTQLAEYSEIKISLAMELFSDRASDIYARIIRTEILDDKYCSSLEFTIINSEAQNTIKQYIDMLVGSAA